MHVHPLVVVPIQYLIGIATGTAQFILIHSLQKHILSWSQLLDIGEDLPESRLDDRLKRLAINHCCTLIYDTPDEKGAYMFKDHFTSDV